jgi:hypothetical protein
MARGFFQIMGVLCLALLMTACGHHPNPQATPEQIRAGAEIFRAQQEAVAAIQCPAGTRRRDWVDAEVVVVNGRGGQPTGTPRVQCVPQDARPEEIPPLARPASPLPSQPHGQRFLGNPYNRWGPSLPSLGHHGVSSWGRGHDVPRCPAGGWYDPSSARCICRNWFGGTYECLW